MRWPFPDLIQHWLTSCTIRQRLAQKVHALNNNTDEDSKDAAAKLSDDQLKEATFYRLETLGYRVGLGMVEKYATTAQRYYPPPFALSFGLGIWLLLVLTTDPQSDPDLPCSSPTTLNRPRPHKIPLQRRLDSYLSQADRQPKDKPPRHLRFDRQCLRTS